MSKKVKTLIIIAVCLIFIGAALAGIGALNGGRFLGGLYIDQSGLHYSGGKTGETVPFSYENLDAPSFDSIKIAMMDANVTFVKSDKYGVKVELENAIYTPKIEIRNDELSIKMPGSNGWRLDFDWLGGNSDLYGGEVTVYLPSNTLDDVRIDLLSGSLDIDGYEFDELVINAVSMDYSISGITANSFESSTVSGSADVSFERAGRIKAANVSGDLLFSGKVSGNITANTVSGRIALNLKGSENDFHVMFSSVSGELRIGGSSYRSDSKIGGGSQAIDLSTVSGNADIEFGE